LERESGMEALGLWAYFDAGLPVAKSAHNPCTTGQFQRIFWDLRPGHKPDISLEKYKAVIKLLVAATVGC
jgi:hypothetical protein